MDERRRYELYAALERLLEPEPAAYLMGMLEEIRRSPTQQRWNRDRIARNPDPWYRIYARFHGTIGADATATFFELFDPLAWRDMASPSSASNDDLEVARSASGGNHGGQ